MYYNTVSLGQHFVLASALFRLAVAGILLPSQGSADTELHRIPPEHQGQKRPTHILMTHDVSMGACEIYVSHVRYPWKAKCHLPVFPCVS